MLQLVGFLCKLVVISILQKGKDMKKLIWGLAIVVVVAVFGGRAWWLYQHKETGDNVVKVGVVLSLTGNNSLIGELSRNALLLAEEEINKSGRYPFKISLQMEDSKSTPKDSITAYQRLRAQGIDLMIVSSDPSALAIGPLARGQNVLILADASGKDVNQSSDMVINFMVPSEIPAEKVGYFGTKSLGLKTFGLIEQKERATQTMGNAFERVVKDNGGELLATEYFPMDAQDTRAIVLKVLDKNPEAIAVFGWGPGYTNTLNTLRELGYKGAILTEYSVVSQQVNLANNGEGIVFADTIFGNNSSDEKVQNFLKNYRNKFGNKTQPDIFAAQVYEALNILADSVGDANYTPNNVYNRILTVKNRPSIIGTINFKNRFIDYPFYMKQLQPDGTAKIVKE